MRYCPVCGTDNGPASAGKPADRPEDEEKTIIYSGKDAEEFRRRMQGYEDSGKEREQYSAPEENSHAGDFSGENDGYDVYSSGDTGQDYYDPAEYVPIDPEPDETASAAKKTNAVLITVIVLLSLALIGIAIFFFTGKDKKPEETTTIETVSETETETTTETTTRALVPSEISEKTKPSNVGIIANYEDYDEPGEGSGFIWKEVDGETYIITCAHCIDGYGTDITVQTDDGEEYDAYIVGYDIKTDVGLVKIQATGLTTAEIGDSDDLKVGDPVYAVGNPGGMKFFGSFSSGHVTALNRNLTSESGYDMKCIQHDATINPGNSGGMLVNERGEVVGINSSKFMRVGFEGMDFAIPINDALVIIDDLMQYGYVPGRPKLGFRYISIFETYFYSPYYYKYDWPDGSLVIMGADADSVVSEKGLNYFDVVTEVNGEPLDDEYSIIKILNQSEIGDTLTLTILRAYSLEHIDEFTVQVTLIQDRGAVRVIELPDTEMDPETTEPETEEETTRRGFFDIFEF